MNTQIKILDIATDYAPSLEKQINEALKEIEGTVEEIMVLPEVHDETGRFYLVFIVYEPWIEVIGGTFG